MTTSVDVVEFVPLPADELPGDLDAPGGPLPFDPAEPFTFAPPEREARIWQRHYLQGSATAETTMDMVAAARFRYSAAARLTGLRTRSWVVTVPPPSVVRSPAERAPALIPTGAALAADTAKATGPDWRGHPAAPTPTSAEVASTRGPMPSPP